MTQQQLEKYLWGAATALRGTIDAGDYKQYIFPLLFFKRICDVYDEEFEKALEESDGDLEYAAFAEHHHFLVPEHAHWKKVRETTVNIGMAIQEAMREIEKANPETLFGIFGDARSPAFLVDQHRNIRPNAGAQISGQCRELDRIGDIAGEENEPVGVGRTEKRRLLTPQNGAFQPQNDRRLPRHQRTCAGMQLVRSATSAAQNLRESATSVKPSTRRR